MYASTSNSKKVPSNPAGFCPQPQQQQNSIDEIFERKLRIFHIYVQYSFPPSKRLKRNIILYRNRSPFSLNPNSISSTLQCTRTIGRPLSLQLRTKSAEI